MKKPVDPVLTRKNLIVCSFAFVTKLNIENGPQGLVQSTGVQVRFPDGSVSTANVNNGGEVIMTAGSVRTPQLLELSGIGNQDILKNHDIPVKLSLPGVGENYEDQLSDSFS
jgi:choline dehydrogenase-like flavoprotein